MTPDVIELQKEIHSVALAISQLAIRIEKTNGYLQMLGALNFVLLLLIAYYLSHQA